MTYSAGTSSTATSAAPTTADSPSSRPERKHRSRSPGSRWGSLGWTLAAAGLVVVAWTLISASGRFPPALFPSVPDIARAGYGMWTDGLLAGDLASSLRRALTGFTIGAAAGICAAVLTATTRVGYNLLQPVLRLLAPIPTIGLVPLAILWFGLGEGSKNLVIALGVFVPVWINSHAGLASTPADYLQAARCLGAGRIQTLVRIVLPEAVPDIVSGLRVGAAMAFVLIVVAEMTGTTAGIGYRIYQAQMFSQADRLISCLIVLGILGALCDTAIASIARPFTRWASEEH